MLEVFNTYLMNPLPLLYGLLAVTYGLVVVKLKVAGHGSMARCYVASALLHGLIAIWHIGHV